MFSQMRGTGIGRITSGTGVNWSAVDRNQIAADGTTSQSGMERMPGGMSGMPSGMGGMPSGMGGMPGMGGSMDFGRD